MARTTFGPSGERITIVDATERGTEDAVIDIAGESDESDIADNSGTDGESEDTSGDGAGSDSNEDRSDTVRFGETKVIDPANIQQPKRRGRKPGTKNRPRTANATTSQEIVTANLEKVLYNLHVMASGLLTEPELAITEDDAKLLAVAVKQVATAYDFTAILNPKTQALVDMGIAVTAVYGGRVTRIIKKHGRRANLTVMQPQANA